MQNKKFLFTSMALAVVANVAIIGCNRQGSEGAKAVNTASIVPVRSNSIEQQQASVGQENAPAERNLTIAQ